MKKNEIWGLVNIFCLFILLFLVFFDFKYYYITTGYLFIAIIALLSVSSLLKLNKIYTALLILLAGGLYFLSMYINEVGYFA